MKETTLDRIQNIVAIATIILFGALVYKSVDIYEKSKAFETDRALSAELAVKQHEWAVRMEAISITIEADQMVLQEIASEKQKLSQSPVKCLTDNIYYEAGFQPYEGQLAVAQVTINRARNPSNICQIVYFKKVNPNTGKKEAAFSWTLGRKWKPRGINIQAYRECAEIARAVLTRHVRSDIIDASVKFYHRVDMTPRWESEHMLVAQIGDHVFYR